MAITYILTFFFLPAAILGGVVKLTARVYRRTRISWKRAFVYGAFVQPIASIAYLGVSIVLPFAVAKYAGLAVSIAVGAWFLAFRAIDSSGQPIGLKPALLLSAIANLIRMPLIFALYMLFMNLFARL